MFTSKTIRRKAGLPQTRKLMKSLNTIEQELRRLKKLVAEVESIELASNAMLRASNVKKKGMMKEPDVIRQAVVDRETLFGEEVTKND